MNYALLFSNINILLIVICTCTNNCSHADQPKWQVQLKSMVSSIAIIEPSHAIAGDVYGNVNLYDINSGELTQSSSLHNSAVMRIAVSNSKKHICTIGYDDEMIYCAIKDQIKVLQREVIKSGISNVWFSQDDNSLFYTKSRDTGDIYCYNTTTERFDESINMSEFIKDRDPLFDPILTFFINDKKCSIVSKQHICVLDRLKNIVEYHQAYPKSKFSNACFNSDGSKFYAIDILSKECPIKSFNLNLQKDICLSAKFSNSDHGNPYQFKMCQAGVLCIYFSKGINLRGGLYLQNVSGDWNRIIDTGKTFVDCIDLSGDGKKVIVGTRDGKISMYDTSY